MLAAIWAQDEQGLIGKQQKMPWHLPNDLKYFKAMTEQKTIVMGRTTFEGMKQRPLPNRQTIILSGHQVYQDTNVRTMSNIAEVLDFAATSKQDVFIAGGSQVYAAFLPFVERLYRTVIFESFAGDAYFPAINWQDWQLISKQSGMVDEKNQYAHQFEIYERLTTTPESI